MSCVYKLTFPSGAVYIGKTNRDPEDRWMNGWGYKGVPQVFHAILQEGWKNVKKEIIADGLTESAAARIEMEQIQKYSITFYGRGPAQCDLHSTSSKGEPAQHFSQEDKCTVLLNEAGMPQSTLREASRGFFDFSICTSGKKEEPDTKKRGPYMSYVIPIVEKPVGMRTCPVSVYTKDGEYIATYPSVKVASKATDVGEGDIVSCCKGKRSDGKPRYQTKGFTFRYSPSLV